MKIWQKVLVTDIMSWIGAIKGMVVKEHCEKPEKNDL